MTPAMALRWTVLYASIQARFKWLFFKWRLITFAKNVWYDWPKLIRSYPFSGKWSSMRQQKALQDQIKWANLNKQHRDAMIRDVDDISYTSNQSDFQIMLKGENVVEVCICALCSELALPSPPFHLPSLPPSLHSTSPLFQLPLLSISPPFHLT